jgi:uncharacterized protein YhjY with autotransporter beta-barrel domain
MSLQGRHTTLSAEHARQFSRLDEIGPSGRKRRARPAVGRSPKLPAWRAALLATSSAAALVMGVGTNKAEACLVVTGASGPVSLNGQTCAQITNATVTGSVANSGVFGPNGLTITNSTISNGVAHNGTSFGGGIGIDAASHITGFTAVGIAGGGTFTGGVTNAGTLTATVQTGISLGLLTTFSGGITNHGTIMSAVNGISVFNGVPVGGFSGGIVNTGTIAAASSGVGTGIIVSRLSLFTGGITNEGAITGNNGISAGAPSPNGVSTFVGGITNNGSVTASSIGIRLVNVPNFIGDVVNNGSLVAATGIQVLGGVTFAAGNAIINSGTITGSTSAIDLTGESAPMTIDQRAGVITGPILLSALGDTVNVTGGTINGNIVGPGASGTINFSPGAGNTFTYAATFGFSGVAQANFNSGTVLLNGVNSASAAAVNSGGTLAGTGTLNAPLTINSGGTFSPGTPGVPGTSMTIGSNATFEPGSTYRVFVNPATSSFSTITGTAALSGTVNAVYSPGSYVAKQYLILQSAGLNGTTFSGLNDTNLPGGFDAFLSYNADDAFLNLIAALGAGTALNVNQQNVANAINNFFNNNNGALPPGFAGLFNLSGANLANALTLLSGENATGAERTAFGMMTQFLNLMTDPYVSCSPIDPNNPRCPELQALGVAPEQQASLPPALALAYASYLKAPYLKAPPAPPTFAPHWTAWGAGFGGVNHANGDAVIGSHDITASDFGFAAGMDYHYSPDTLFGFALAGGGTNWDLAQGLGTGRSDTFMAGVHGTTYFGPAYLKGSLAFANHWFTTDRTSFDSDQLRAKFTGQSYGVRLEGGYRFAVPFERLVVGLTPYAAVQAQSFHTPTYSETDLTGGGFGLTYSSMTANDTRSELGARTDLLTTFYGSPLILRGRLAWAHDWVDNPALNAAFQALPGSSFTVFGAPIPHNSALTTTAAELHFAPNWSFTAKFDGELASGSQTYAGTGTLRYTW